MGHVSKTPKAPVETAPSAKQLGTGAKPIHRTNSGNGQAPDTGIASTNCLEAALELVAQYGWKIFPADVAAKKSFLSAQYAPGGERWGQTNNPKQLTRNFSKRKWRHKCGVGVPTGEDNGIFVIEGDTVKGHDVDGLASIQALEVKHGKLPDTLMAESPSGSPHRYYKHPGGYVKSTDNEIAPGVDIKGDGGMVIAPPSVRADGAYRWVNDLPIADAPAWLKDLVKSEERAAPDAAPVDENDLPDITTIETMLAIIPNDDDVGYNVWMELLMSTADGTRGTPAAGMLAFDAFSRKNPDKYYAKRDYKKSGSAYLIKKWAEFAEKRPRDITYRTLYHHADRAMPGWRDLWPNDPKLKPLLDAFYALKNGDVVSKQGEAEAPPKDEASDNNRTAQEKTGPTDKGATSSGIVLVRASDVIMRPREWLWKGHLLRGALELLTGLPGNGKSQVQNCFMACATGRLPWPDGAPAIEPVNVIMVTAEDAIDTEVVPRLTAAGADCTRVHILKYIKTDKLERQFPLTEDLVRLRQAVAQIGNVGLICIDPITAYMGGKVDAHKTTEVRSQLSPLKDFSEEVNAAVSAITHPAKNAGAKAIDHFIGSQAFIAAARIGHACFEEIEVDDETGDKKPTGRFLFTNVKYSSTIKMPTLAYKIAGVFLTPQPFVEIETSRVVWDKEAVNTSAEQAIAAAGHQAKTIKQQEAAASEVVDLIRSMIDAGDGWCKQTEIAAQAKALGYSDKELRTARNHLCVVSKKQGFDGPWMWGWEGKRPLRF